MFQISRGDRIRTCDPLVPNQVRYQLRYAPNFLFLAMKMAVKPGFEPGVQSPVRQFSKLVVSATHPLHHSHF
jgi:hypothetical protein